MRVQQFLTEDKWCKDAYAETESGRRIYKYEDLERAARFCLVGAIDYCYDEDGISQNGLYSKVYEVLKKHNYPVGLIEFNDNPVTEFNDVKKVLEEAKI